MTLTFIVLLVVISVLIGIFSYYTNAGFGDRRPKDAKKDQPSVGAPDEDVPPPHK